jgi:hypothetical protein
MSETLEPGFEQRTDKINAVLTDGERAAVLKFNDHGKTVPAGWLYFHIVGEMGALSMMRSDDPWTRGRWPKFAVFHDVEWLAQMGRFLDEARAAGRFRSDTAEYAGFAVAMSGREVTVETVSDLLGRAGLAA